MTLAGYTACPKCGGPLDSGFNCTRCSWSSIASSQTTQRIASPAAPRAPDAPSADVVLSCDICGKDHDGQPHPDDVHEERSELLVILDEIEKSAVSQFLSHPYLGLSARILGALPELRALAASRSQPAAPVITGADALLVRELLLADSSLTDEHRAALGRFVLRGAATEAPRLSTADTDWLLTLADSTNPLDDLDRVRLREIALAGESFEAFQLRRSASTGRGSHSNSQGGADA